HIVPFFLWLVYCPVTTSPAGHSSTMYAPRLSRYSTVRSSTLPPAYQEEKPVPCQARRWMVSSRQRIRRGLRLSLLNADVFAVLTWLIVKPCSSLIWRTVLPA